MNALWEGVDEVQKLSLTKGLADRLLVDFVVGNAKRHIVRERSADESRTLWDIGEEARRMLPKHTWVLPTNSH
jgi:hypothetical protein